MRTKQRVRMLTLTALCTIFLAAPGVLWGRTLYVDQAAAGRQDGASWAGAFPYLQDALAVAVAGDEIRVAQGQYRPDQGLWRQPGDRQATFQLINGVTILGGFAGAAGADPNQRDPAGFPTILTGDLAGNDAPNDESTWPDNSLHVITSESVSDDTVLDGLIIAHGYADDQHGAALYNEGGKLRIRDCTFRDNHADHGDGGVYSYQGNLRIEHCRFLRNGTHEGSGTLRNCEGSLEVIASEFMENGSGEDGAAAVDNEKGRAVLFGCLFRANGNDSRGTVSSSGTLSLLYCTFADNEGCCGVGGLTCADGSATIAHCLFYRNRADRAGALSITGGSVSLEQCTFYGNDCTDGPPGGVYCRPPSPAMDGVLPAASLHVNTCIFWANSGEDWPTSYRAQISGDSNSVTVEYCCVQGWIPQCGGLGNIGTDPLFVAPDQNDFHLQSQAGHWDAASLAWVLDDVTSPCIDAGDPNSSVGPEPFPNGGRVNMGVYGGTCEASKSWFGVASSPGVNAADLNGDGRVDAEDFRLALLRQSPPTTAP